jgi:nicotinate-nucleotide pyrophosphorylase (carboxylating)
MKSVPFGPLEPGLYREIVRRALAEDLGWGDVTTEATVNADQRARGIILAKSPCVLAGLDLAAETYRQLDPAVTFTAHRQDSNLCAPGDVVAEVRGAAAAMLTAERTALNLLQRMSGIATLTRRFVDAAAGRITILDTRKTTPTLRALEKYAVRAGGGVNHRFDLSSAVMIKDNHLVAVGSISEAVVAARAEVGPDVMIVVEVVDLEQLAEAVATDADRVLLDNMSPDLLGRAVALVDGRLVTEASGGITADNVRRVAETGVDLISVGWITHSAPQLDIALDFLSSSAEA